MTSQTANQAENPASTTLTIRRAAPGDAAALAAFKRRTFRETFVDGPIAVGYSPENIAAFEADSYSEAHVASEIADPRKAQWVVEGADGALLAYAHAGPCKLPHEDVGPDQGELYQLYVREDWQGHRLGARLMDVALDWLAENLPGPVWIGVYSENFKAQAVYAKRGFVKVGDYFFKVGAHRDHEFILRRD